MTKPLSIIARAFWLRRNSPAQSPEYIVATGMLYFALSVAERFALKTIADRGHLGAAANTAAQQTLTRLLALGFIIEHEPIGKKRQFTLTEMGKEINDVQKVDINRHFEWYIGEKENGKANQE